MAEIKQYMNLEPNSSEESHGRVRKISLSMDKKQKSVVTLTLKPDGGNKAAKDLKAEHRAGVGAIATETFSTPTESDGSFEFSLIMSNHGGDKFSVEASTDPEGKKGAKPIPDTYVVWKKLYYQLSKMKSSFAFPFDKVKGEYEKYFIELEETSTVSVPYSENLETAELKGYRKNFKKKESPFEAHVVLIDRQCDSQEKQFNNIQVKKKKTVLKYPETEWPFSNWLVSSASRVKGGVSEKGKISVKQIAGGIEIDVTGTGADPSKDSVFVDVTIRTLKGEYTGDATYKPHVFIAVGKKRSDSSKCKTVGHEIGHAVGMVPRSGHDKQYSNENGGMGSHCRSGASPNKKSKAQGGTFLGKYTGGTCVMFAYSSEHYKFCDTCKEFVLDAELYKTSMNSRGWG
jgi:hypothetical protein